MDTIETLECGIRPRRDRRQTRNMNCSKDTVLIRCMRTLSSYPIRRKEHCQEFPASTDSKDPGMLVWVSNLRLGRKSFLHYAGLKHSSKFLTVLHRSSKSRLLEFHFHVESDREPKPDWYTLFLYSPGCITRWLCLLLSFTSI